MPFGSIPHCSNSPLTTASSHALSHRREEMRKGESSGSSALSAEVFSRRGASATSTTSMTRPMSGATPAPLTAPVPRTPNAPSPRSSPRSAPTSSRFPTIHSPARSASRSQPPRAPTYGSDGNDYSIPHHHVGRSLTVSATLQTVRILDATTVLATHRRSFDRAQQIEDPAHIEALERHKRSAREHRATDRLHHAAPSAKALFGRRRRASPPPRCPRPRTHRAAQRPRPPRPRTRHRRRAPIRRRLPRGGASLSELA